MVYIETATSFGMGVVEDQVRGKGGAIFKREGGGAGSCWWTVVVGR